MANTSSLKNLFANIASSIRTKDGSTGKMSPKDFATKISNLETGTNATATSGDIINGKTAVVNNQKITGNLTFQTCYVTTTTPDNSSGQEGDLWIVTG